MALLLPPTPTRKMFGKSDKLERKSNGKKGDCIRILITVTILGSAGPIRFVVREEELVSVVIGTALKNYSREGRCPILGCNVDDFVLYHAFDGSHGLNPLKPIGSFRSRNFLLFKKQRLSSEEWSVSPGKEIEKKGMCVWMACLNKSLAFISSQ